MLKNLLKNMLLALFLTVAVPTMNAQTAHVGDILCEGDLIVSPANYPSSGATAKAVVFYVDNTGQHGWAIALENLGVGRWGAFDDTPLTNFGGFRQAIYDLDGYYNTQIVRAFGSNDTGNYFAFFAVDFENGWYLPALGQLNYLYGNLDEVNASLNVVGGSQFVGNWQYWSSTECHWKNAWYLTHTGEIHNRNNVNNYNDESKRLGKSVRAAINF